MSKALIAMSGGVDSAVAALLTKQAGFDCIGVTMRLHDGEAVDRDLDDAAALCEKMGIPFRPLDLRDRFREAVIGRFIDEYERGRTPNPCIECNRVFKFGVLHETAREWGCDLVVTGHYARIVEEGGVPVLKKAADRKKDQSYVLYTLSQETLARTRFPLGGLTKEGVRAIAAENGFVNAHKSDSQDICFVPDGDYAAVIEAYTGRTYPAGDFVDTEGRVLGRHKGLIRYTVGQRKGLGLALPAPLYVTEKRVADNTVVLAPNEAHFSTTLTAGEVNWCIVPPTAPFHAAARVRYNAAEQPALITPTDGGFSVRFDTPVRAVTAGQSVVLYDGDTVLGGGIIE